MCDLLLQDQSDVSNFAMLTQYKLIIDILHQTKIPIHVLLPKTVEDRVRAHRHLCLVEDSPFEDMDAIKMAEIRNQVEDLLWKRLSAKRLAAEQLLPENSEEALDDEILDAELAPDLATDLTPDLDGLPHPNAVVGVASDASDVTVDDKDRHGHRKWPRWSFLRKVTASHAVAVAVFFVGLFLGTELWAPSVAPEQHSAADNARLSQPVAIDVDDSSQSFDMGDFSVMIQRSNDIEGEGQVEIELLNKSSEERSMQFNVSAGGQQWINEPTTLQPGETMRRVVPMQWNEISPQPEPYWHKGDLFEIDQENSSPH